MPISFVEGDILEAKTHVIVNTVNCKGVMGKGLALQFKKKYPAMYKEYKEQCKEGNITIGKLHLYKNSPNRWILNFPTKNHWRQKSKLEYIEKGLLEFKQNYEKWGITSIAFPRLGCQQGGLNWADVKPLMEKYLADLPNLNAEVFSYVLQPKKLNKKNRLTKRPLSERLDQRQRTLGAFNKADTNQKS